MLCTFGYTVLFLGKHYQSVLQSPGCAQARASAVCGVKIPFHSKHAVPFPFTDKTGCQRDEEGGEAATARPASAVTVRCAGDKQSVSPAFKSCVSAVVVAGSIAPRLLLLLLLPLLYAPAPVNTHHNINCVIRLQCLPRDGDRPPATGPCRLNYNNTPSTGLLSPSVQAEKLSVRPPLTVCWCSFSFLTAPGGGGGSLRILRK